MSNVPGLKRIKIQEQEERLTEQGSSATGCVYSKVCPRVFEKCSSSPPMYNIGSEHHAACFLYDKTG